MAKSYQLVLKYLDYNKDANPNAHVKVFNVVVKTNEKNLKNTWSMHSVYMENDGIKLVP